MKIMGKNKLLSRWRKGDILLKIYEHCGKQGYWLRGKTYKWQFINGVEHLLPLSSANFYNEDCGCDATEYRVKEYFGMNGATPCDNDHYINPNKRIIWTNNDYNEWREAMIADMEEGETEDDFDYERYGEYCDVCLYDERANLDIEVDGIIVAFVNLGLWDGRHLGGGIVGTNVKNILHSECDYVDWYCDKYNVLCDASHHDGTNHYIYRVAKNKEQAENLIHKIAYEGMTKEEFFKATKSLRKYVANTYGW